MRMLPLLLWLSVSYLVVHGSTDGCSNDRVQTLPTDLYENQYVVRYNSQPCGAMNYTQSPVICGNSGWGDEEATVVCRSEKSSIYGLGGYISVVGTHEVGYSSVNCDGNEEILEDCEIGNLTSHECSEIGIAHCMNDTQVVVIWDERQNFQYMEVSENETLEFCVFVWGPLTEPVHLLIETTDHQAIANYDYIHLQETVVFEASESHHCLKIELINDSLGESWETFTITLSMIESSPANLTRHEITVYIRPNDDQCISGNLTAVRDADNSGLQLVEGCDDNKRVWSPLCDNEWTLQDATVVCRELGYQVTDSVRYDTVNNTNLTAGTSASISCRGSETSLSECSLDTLTTVCQLLLVDCNFEINVRDPDMDADDNTEGSDDVDTSSDSEDSNVSVLPEEETDVGKGDGKSDSELGSTAGIVSGVVVAVLLLLISVVAVIAVIVCILRRKTQKATASPKQVKINQIYESQDMFGGGETATGEGEKHLANPVYSLCKDPELASSVEEEPEHHLQNPLYSLAAEPPHRDIYSDVGPEYAVPEKVKMAPSANGAHPLPPPIYEYAENI